MQTGDNAHDFYQALIPLNPIPGDTPAPEDTQSVTPVVRPTQVRFSIVLALLAALALLIGTCAVIFWVLSLFQTTPVTIAFSDQAFAVQTRGRSVADLLQEQSINLGAGDTIQPSLDTPITPDLIVWIVRARPIMVMVDGQLEVVNTTQTNPATILVNAGIELGPADQVVIDGTIASRGELSTWPVPVSNLTVRRAMSFTVQDGNDRHSLVTTSATVGEALFEAGITLYVADSIVPELDTQISPGLVVTIRRARPVTIIVDGDSLQTRIQGMMVTDALVGAGVALIGLDYAIPHEDTPLVSGMTIRVIRVEEDIVTENTDMPFETIWQADSSLELDQQQVLQAGQMGLQQTVTRVRYENGIEVDRAVEESQVVRAAANRVIAYGTNIVLRTIETPQGLREYWRRVRMYATSYHPAALGGDDVTATGRRLTTGIIASDPDVIAYGTEIYVDGYGVGLMADTGGPRRFPLWIDLGYGDAEFRPWSRYVDVYLLTPVPEDIDYVLPR